MTATLTPEQQLTALKHLASGKPIDVTATILHTDTETIRGLAASHGYPDREKLAWAVDVLTSKADAAHQHSAPPADRGRPLSAVARERVAPSPMPAAAPSRPDELRILLNTAKSHPAKRIQTAANKIFDDLDRLRALIRDDEERHAAKRAADAEKAKLRAQVAQLEQQLRQAKEKLRGPGKSTTTVKTPRATVPKGEFPCRLDGCDRVYDTPQGRSMHERMKCPHRPAQAAS